jgi:predicted O-linked N-acetylglucosamine transferase (SPINDLY family)
VPAVGWFDKLRGGRRSTATPQPRAPTPGTDQPLDAALRTDQRLDTALRTDQPLDAALRTDQPLDAALRTDQPLDTALRHIELGNGLENAGDLAAALRCYQQALALRPDLPRVHLSLGNVAGAQGRLTDALAAYERALELDPNYASAHFNRGNALARMRRLDDALAAHQRAAALKPEFVDARVALGNTYFELRQFAEAARSYREALALRPDYAPVHFSLANVLREQDRLDEAAEACRAAIRLDPDLAEAHYTLAVMLGEQQLWVEALAAARRAAALKTDFGAALGFAYHMANRLCDWSRRPDDERELQDMVRRGVGDLAPLPLLNIDLPEPGDAAANLQRRAGRQWAEGQWSAAMAEPLADASARPVRERLRIGYLSCDFYQHPVTQLLQGVLTAHDRERFAVHAYSYGSRHDSVTDAVLAGCEVFRDLEGRSDLDAARLIESDGIDILVDLKGYTEESRMGIVALRPAPLLVSWLGYAATLGHPALADYIIGDPVVTPAAHAGHYSEKLAVLPHCYMPHDRSRPIAARPSRREAGLPEHGLVFCSFNQSAKLSPAALDAWCEVLRALPESVLWLTETCADVTANVRREAAARGVRAERWIFAPKLPSVADHLGRLGLADLALDTFPYNSHATASDALWAGVPLLTRCGETFSSRVAASLLTQLDLAELITSDWAGYVGLCVALGRDPLRLQSLRQRLAERRVVTPLFDTVGFTRDLEQLYRTLWQA